MWLSACCSSSTCRTRSRNCTPNWKPQQPAGADPEDPGAYRAKNIFWVPRQARWAWIRDQARQPTVGQLIDLVSTIRVGDADSRSKDVLGRMYEYFLSQFASADGKKGGEFYTPRSVVTLLVEMIEPYRGRVYDPCCGSSGMFVQSESFIRAHGGRLGDISICGQESNCTTWRLARMNLAILGVEGQIAHGDTFHNDRHPDLRADFILANPPSTSATGGASYSRPTSAGHMACRRPATPTSRGYSTSSATSHPAASPASCSLTDRCPPASRAKARSGRT